MRLPDRGTALQGSSAHQRMPRPPGLPWAACFVDPRWTASPEPPALLNALGHLSPRWPLTVPSRASVGSGTPGVGTWKVGERSPPSWPRQKRTYCRGHVGWHPVGRRLSGPLRISLGMMASLNCSCCWSPGLTRTKRPGHQLPTQLVYIRHKGLGPRACSSLCIPSLTGPQFSHQQ